MLTNPSTLGLFEEDIVEIAEAVHGVGGLLYYDGANLNAILGVVRPGDMGFDIVHLNVHKTFATPHGGGGPGAGPVAVSAELAHSSPARGPPVTGSGFELRCPSTRSAGCTRGTATPWCCCGRWIYLRLNGGDGLKRVSEIAVLNAQLVQRTLRGTYDIPYDRP